MRYGLRNFGVTSEGTSCESHLRGDANLQRNDSLLEILRGLRHVLWPAEIAPVIFVGAEAEDFFSLGGEPQVRGDDGERAFLHHQREQTRRDYVDARKSQRL